MRTSDRNRKPTLIERLFDVPERFSFTQAVWLLLRWLADRSSSQEDWLASHLRFRNSTSLNFPTSEVLAIESTSLPVDSSMCPESALDQADLTPGAFELTPAFFGMLGICGVLPYAYSEMLDELASNQRDQGPKAFLDAFSTRGAALHYLAGVKYRIHLHNPITSGLSFQDLLHALAGRLATEKNAKAPNELIVPPQFFAFFAPALRHRPCSTAYLHSVLQSYFSLPFQIESFVGAWYSVPAQQRTVLGRANHELGRSALLGSQIWQRHLRQRITIGPLDRVAYRRFLPGRDAARALGRLLFEIVGTSMEYEVRLILMLGPDHGSGVRLHAEEASLGEDTFLRTREVVENRSDMTYLIDCFA